MKRKHLNRETNRYVEACPEPPFCQHPLHDQGVHCQCGRLYWGGRCHHQHERNKAVLVRVIKKGVQTPDDYRAMQIPSRPRRSA